MSRTCERQLPLNDSEKNLTPSKLMRSKSPASSPSKETKSKPKERLLPLSEHVVNSIGMSSVQDLNPSKCLHVADGISSRIQNLKQRLSQEKSSTAHAYSKEVVRRMQELEALKRPVKSPLILNDSLVENVTPKRQEESIKQITFQKDIKLQDNDSNGVANEAIDDKVANETIDDKVSNELINDEVANEAVSDAFKDIDNLSVEDSDDCLELPQEDAANMDDKIVMEFNIKSADKQKPIDELQSPTKKNRLYPDLKPLEECDLLHGMNLPVASISPPPAKPPRLTENTPKDERNSLSNIQANSNTPLRTISFYRREQIKSYQNSPSPAIVFGVPQSHQPADEDKNKIKMIIDVEKKIKALRDEGQAQMTIIQQASKALSLCLEKNEFSGSVEQIEAERLLLLASMCLFSVQFSNLA